MHVENLTHSLTGAVIARTGLGDKVPFGTAALVVAANLPDLDSVATFWGILVYLDYHRGVTHSVLGIVGLSCLFTGLLWLLNQKRGNPINTTFRAILGPVTLVVATHSLMDFTNSYGWRPFLPFLEQWYYGDLVFIVDPYLWLLFGGAVFLTGRQSAVTLFFWIAGAAFLLYLVGVQRIIGPGHEGVSTVWIVSIVSILVLKWRRRVWTPLAAWYALVGLLLYLTLLFSAQQYGLSLAYREIRERHPKTLQGKLSALPRFADPFNWDLFVEDPLNIYHARLSLVRGMQTEFQAYPRDVQHPAVQAVLSTCPGSVMAHFARYEFFEVVPQPKGPLVILRDARYAREATSGWGVLGIPLSPDLRSHRLNLPCPGEGEGGETSRERKSVCCDGVGLPSQARLF